MSLKLVANKPFIDPFTVRKRNPETKSEPVATDDSIPTATNQIYDYIAQYLGRVGDDRHVNRASAASRCYKQRWYQRNGFPGEPLTPRVIVNFTLGDLSEHTVKFFIKNGCVGPGKLYSEVDFGNRVGSFPVQGGREIEIFDQPDLLAQIGEINVSAHVDGWGKRNSDGKWELIEVKSAADYGFEEFKEQGPGDYLKQAMVNLQTDRAKELGADGVRFFYIKKNTGSLWDRFFPFDRELASDVATEYQLAASDEEPKAPYVPKIETFRSKPTGRKVLEWRCSYCPYKQHCYEKRGKLSLEMKNGKPIWVVT